MFKHPEKAGSYLQSLDDARCNSKWAEVPELARKVGKHAPTRKCLITVAKAECEIIQEADKGSSGTSQAPSKLEQLVPTLTAAIGEENASAEDVFQAQTALGWLYWVQKHYESAVSALPSNPPERIDGSAGEPMAWTYVCIIKCIYMRGASHEILGNRAEALESYKKGLSYTKRISPAKTSGISPEQKAWTERLFTRFCMLSSNMVAEESINTKSVLEPETALAPFRTWSALWDGKHGGLLFPDGTGLSKDIQIRRRLIWQAYFTTLSSFLKKESLYPVEHPTTDRYGRRRSYHNTFQPRPSTTRAQIYKELRHVETVYEGLLLKEVSFPEAGQTNVEVDDWTNQVMANWGIICGPTWQDHDIGEGGQEAASRVVLDILYNVATRSFHSTALLRHLFTVHASLAEFKLAGNALASYLDIVGRAEARAEKSGQPEPGLDDHETVLRTTTMGIHMFCTIGRRQEAEKAQELAYKVERWLREHESIKGSKARRQSSIGRSSSIASSPRSSTFDSKAESHRGRHHAGPSGSQHGSHHGSMPSGTSIAAAHRAIGISNAHWARLTYEASKRAELQAKAIANFRAALSSDLDDEENIETLYALGLMLAETRDIDGAIACAKAALAVEPPIATSNGKGNAFAVEDERRSVAIHEGRMIKVWHLMALLLSGRQDFDRAQDSCNAALDQWVNAEVSAVDSLPPMMFELSLYEKLNLVELKLTQLALAEVSEGPEIAVSAGGELLGLYSKLFNYPEIMSSATVAPTSQPRPQTANGTIKSLRGNLFGRSPKAAAEHLSRAKEQVEPHNTPELPDQSQGPTISVTDDDSPSSSGAMHHTARKLQKQNSIKSLGSLRKGRLTSLSRTVPYDDHSKLTINRSLSMSSETTVEDLPMESNSGEVGLAVSNDLSLTQTLVPDANDPATMTGKPLSPMLHNYNFKKPPPPLGHPTERPVQDMRLPISSPSAHATAAGPRFAQLEQQRQILSLLLKLWLVIGGIYRRAKLYEDAQGAVDEALKIIRDIEAAVADTDSSAQAFEQQGWAGMKSVEELWADVYAERGHLCEAKSDPHGAIRQYESALSHFADHPAATVGLSNLLLDIYAKIIPSHANYASPPSPKMLTENLSLPILASIPAPPYALDDKIDVKMNSMDSDGSRPLRSPTFLSQNSSNESLASPTTAATTPMSSGKRQNSSSHTRKTQEAVDRLAARDRAYGLLSALTKLGTSWDSSEAWFALARAYEESGQPERAKEVLWWVVELEEKRPVRGWGVLGWGGSLPASNKDDAARYNTWTARHRQ